MFSQALARCVQSASRMKQFTVGLYGEYRLKSFDTIDVVHADLAERPDNPQLECEVDAFWRVLDDEYEDVSEENKEYLRLLLKNNNSFINKAFLDSSQLKEVEFTVNIPNDNIQIVLHDIVFTPLLIAINYLDIFLIEELLKNDADPNLCVRGKASSLERAIRSEYRQIIALLIQYGAYFIADEEKIEWTRDDKPSRYIYEFLDVCSH